MLCAYDTDGEIPSLPTDCVCGVKFSVQHAMSCKKGGFVTLRHNGLRDVTASYLTEVCKDVKVEPILTTLTGEQFEERTANSAQDARLDISARGFCISGQRAFLDIRVFELNAQRYRNSNLQKCYSKNEDEKNKQYNRRVLQVENASFTPLVFCTTGGMGRKARVFYRRLTEMLSEKRGISLSDATTFLRSKISFCLLRSMLLCIRGGSRSSSRSWVLENVASEDVAISNEKSRFNGDSF